MAMFGYLPLNIIYVSTILIETSKPAHLDANGTDVFVTYAGHSEAEDNRPYVMPKPKKDKAFHGNGQSVPNPGTPVLDGATEPAADVVFIPNEKPVERNGDDYLENDSLKPPDVVNDSFRRVGDVIQDRMSLNEKAKDDVLFVSTKNDDGALKNERKIKHEPAHTKDSRSDAAPKQLDCANLDCNSTVRSVCGGKMDHKQWKYRLFLNECYFRKVNCAFKYPYNRYKLLELSRCDHIGHRSGRRPPPLQPVALPYTNVKEESRRRYSSRRSVNVNADGASCAHRCPAACTDKYEPQCAATAAGDLKTFLNHCKVDLQSCATGVAWHIRPLSECVGGKKADMRQNRGFIAWMQKVGIVDNRGRLVLS